MIIILYSQNMHAFMHLWYGISNHIEIIWLVNQQKK